MRGWFWLLRPHTVCIIGSFRRVAGVLGHGAPHYSLKMGLVLIGFKPKVFKPYGNTLSNPKIIAILTVGYAK